MATAPSTEARHFVPKTFDNSARGGSKTDPEPHLLKHVVRTDNLQCAEYHFMVTVQFDKSPKADSENITRLKDTVGSLANESGGFVTVTDVSGAPISNSVLDGWKRNMKDVFANFMGERYQECIQYSQFDRGLYIFVRPSSQVITKCSYIFIRIDSVSIIVNTASNIASLLRKRKNSPLPSVPDFPCHVGGTIEEVESKRLEFKHWGSASTFEDYKKHFSDERTKKGLLAVMNEDEGGIFIVGVKESTIQNTVLGQRLTQEVQDAVLSFLDSFIQNLFLVTCSEAVSRKAFNLVKGQHYSVDVVIISEEPERLGLITLRFASFEGVVCDKMPESFTLTEDGFVHKLSIKEWLERIKSTPMELEDAFQNAVKLKTSSKSKGDVEEKPNLTKRIQRTFAKVTRRVLSSRQAEVRDGSTQDVKDNLINSDLQYRAALSFTQQNPEWSEDLVVLPLEYHTELTQTLDESQLFEYSCPVNFTPPRNILLQFSTMDLTQMIKDIDDMCADHNGLAIAQQNWSFLLPGDNIIQLPPHHVMDIVLMNDKPEIQFFLVVSSKGNHHEQQKQYSYMFHTARLLKRHMIKILMKDGLSFSISIRCHLHTGTSIAETKFLETLSSQYLGHYKECTAAILREALVEMLLDKDTWLKGTVQMVRMNAEQIKTILYICRGVPDKFNIIKGPPGSGKTFLGLALTKMYGGSVMWIVTTYAFCEYLKHHGVGLVQVVTKDKDLFAICAGVKHVHYNCIIVDDVHHFNCSVKAWTKLFDFVRRESSLHLYLLEDNDIQKYKDNKVNLQYELNQFCRKNKENCETYPLKKIHRNTRKIASYMQTNVLENAAAASMVCVNEEDGHDVEIQRLENLRKATSDNGLVRYLKEITNPDGILAGSSSAFFENDIAILVDGPNADRDVQIFTTIIRAQVTLNVHDATVYPVRGIIVDTVHNFMGLDRKMCIFVIEDKLLQVSTGAGLLNPHYRAFLASRAIYRAVFVVDTLSCNLARTLQFGDLNNLQDHFKGEASLLWQKDLHEVGMMWVTDSAWLSVDSVQNLLVTTNKGQLLLLSAMDGSISRCPLDTSRLPGLIRCVGVSSNDMAVLLAGGGHGLEDCWWCVFRRKQLRGWNKGPMHTILFQPRCAAWTASGQVIIVDKQSISLYDEGGDLKWSRSHKQTLLKAPQAVATCKQGHIYLADGDYIRVLDNSGNPTDTIASPTDSQVRPRLRAIGITHAGTLFIGKQQDSRLDFISMYTQEDSQELRVIETLPRVWSLAVRGHLLALSDEEGCVHLYQVL